MRGRHSFGHGFDLQVTFHVMWYLVYLVYFPPFSRDKRMTTIFRPFSRKKGGKLIFRQGGRRRPEGGFYPRPKFDTVCAV